MVATFGDPLTLSKHDIAPKSTHELAPVLASCSKGSKMEYATIGVHGEGINIIDLTSLQPEAATLLGPESSFACAPVTRVIERGKMEHRRQTYAILNSPPTKAPTRSSQTLSMWSSTEGLTSLQQERSVTLETPAAALYAPDSIPDKVVLISPEGSTTTYNSDLQHSEAESSPLEAQKLLFSFIFDSSHCSFYRGGLFSHLSRAILVTVLQRRKEIHVRVCSVDQTVEVVGETQIQLSGHEIISASCNQEGCLSFFDSSRSLFSFMLQPRREGIGLVSLETLSLQGIHPTGMSINCVGSTHVLVAAFEKVDPGIALLLWDVQYGVLLAEKKVPRPNAVSTISPDRLQLQVVPYDSSQSLLTLFSTNPNSRREMPASGLKAVVMIIPHTVPTSSSLANAIGRANSGERWLTPTSLELSPGSKNYEDGREAMLAGVIEAIKCGQVDAADKVFFEWENEQRALVKALAKEEASRQLAAQFPKRAVNGHAGKGAADLDDAKGVHHDPKIRIKHVPNQIDWGHAFLARLMQVVLRPGDVEAGTPAYSSKIPSYFLERKLISDGIIEGGILKSLQHHEDWVSIRWVLKNTVDVSEDHLMSLLLHSVRLHHKKPKAKMENAMDVDETTHAGDQRTLTLPQVFGHVIAYPTSTPSLRLTIRQHFSQVEDVVILLEVVNTWIFDSAKKTMTIKLGDGDEAPKRGEQTNHERAVEKDGLPRLDLLVAFISCLLDATLMDLLQYRPAHRLLLRLSMRIAPYAPYLENLDRLRGPLEPFVLADRRGRRPWEEQHKKAQKGQQQQKEDNHSLNANLYQIEEFFV